MITTMRRTLVSIIFPVLLLVSLQGYAEQPAQPLPQNEGIVVSTLDTTGYTYMELENGGKRFWIAAPTTQVKKGEHIRFVENMSMHNFTSKTLNKTFDRIIFVTSTQVKQAQ